MPGASQGPATSNHAVERTGHAAGFFPGWASVGRGRRLTAGVMQLQRTGRALIENRAWLCL